MSEIRTDNWANGANNVASPERLPAGFVRDLVNLDAGAGGQLEGRAGFTGVLAGVDMRLAVAMRERVIYVDGDTVGCYAIGTDSAEALGAIAGSAEIAGTRFGDQVFLSTPLESLRTDGYSLKPWAVPAPVMRVELIAGALPAGIYRVAMTALGADGEESGADPMMVRVSEGQAIRVSSDDSRPVKAYVTAPNGATLYSQGLLIGGSMAITGVDDSTEQLTTAGLMPFPFCPLMAAHRGVIVGAQGNYLLFTAPLFSHLMDPIRGFVGYQEPITMIGSTDGGVYVAAGERTYFVTALEGEAISQRVVLDIGAVPGTAVGLPDGRVAWFTRYGQAIGDAAGAVTLPNRPNYAPVLAGIGAAGVLEHNGNALVITTMRGPASPNNLVAGDFAELELVEKADA